MSSTVPAAAVLPNAAKVTAVFEERRLAEEKAARDAAARALAAQEQMLVTWGAVEAGKAQALLAAAMEELDSKDADHMCVDLFRKAKPVPAFCFVRKEDPWDRGDNTDQANFWRFAWPTVQDALEKAGWACTRDDGHSVMIVPAAAAEL